MKISCSLERAFCKNEEKNSTCTVMVATVTVINNQGEGHHSIFLSFFLSIHLQKEHVYQVKPQCIPNSTGI